VKQLVQVNVCLLHSRRHPSLSHVPGGGGSLVARAETADEASQHAGGRGEVLEGASRVNGPGAQSQVSMRRYLFFYYYYF
jgi:hypothetical protein